MPGPLARLMVDSSAMPEFWAAKTALRQNANSELLVSNGWIFEVSWALLACLGGISLVVRGVTLFSGKASRCLVRRHSVGALVVI